MSYVSHADLGGRQLREPVAPGSELPGPFHAHWEERVHALTLAMGATGMWNLDMARAARETLPEYDSLSYYQKWLAGLERLLLERGLASKDELRTGRPLQPPVAVPRVLRARDVPAVLAAGAPTERAPRAPARFAAGERVRMRADAVPHHTRLPAYARGRHGTIERVLGAHVFPDSHARGRGEDPQWLYTVAFTGSELWGNSGIDGPLSVAIDAWEPYLERT